MSQNRLSCFIASRQYIYIKSKLPVIFNTYFILKGPMAMIITHGNMYTVVIGIGHMPSIRNQLILFEWCKLNILIVIME